MNYRFQASALIILGILVGLSLTVPVCASAVAAQRDDMKASAYVIERVSVQGSLPVIVRLRDSGLPFGLFRDKAKSRSEVIKGLQSKVLDDVSAKTARGKSALRAKRFSMVPAMALQVDADALEALLANSDVIDIVEDQLLEPTLEDSVELIGSNSDGAFFGYTGQGQTVAILDTGVDKNHPFLQGKVVSEACYSTNNPTSGVSSLCPGGATSSTASGSGLDCDASIAMCNHGTHVAGIAAGKNSSFSGVAQDASIIAIQVFSKFDDCGSSASPCARSYSSDVIRGLERVYALRGSHQIASVNLSIGGGLYESYCDNSSFKSIIDSLRAAGIATVIASGNNGSTDSLNSPACVSSAVSVGSTTKSDDVSSFSNSADFLTLLAPGSSIESSVPGTGYRSMSGTSMATPHVAGVWAVMKQAMPGAGVSEVLGMLQSAGTPVTDDRSGADDRDTPRVDVQAALVAQGVGIDCSDGLFCNGAETNADGICVDGTPPCGGSTSLCDEARDRCVECLDSSDCSDGVFCNGAEICSAGRCVDGRAPCTGIDSICDEAANQCMECQNNNDCSDGIACNGLETCSGGTCVDGQDSCGGDTPVCNERDDQCVACLDSADCSDGVYCNGDEICSGGTCIEGAAPCGDAESLCDESYDECVECLDSSDCSDGVYCNGDEVCAGGTCVDGAEPCDAAAPLCDEENALCLECENSSDCQSGFVCSENICVEAGELFIAHKKLYSEQLLKKPKKRTLKIIGGDNFDPYAAVTVDPSFTVLKTKFNKKKNVLKVKVLVPVGFPKKTVDVRVGACMGTMEIL